MCAFALLLFAVPSIANSTAAPEKCTASSGKTVVPLVELFTSEGCSSCPPADRWLSKIGDAGSASPATVALAFHVDYWNQLGWDDPYAAAHFTDRQYDYASQWGTRTVYTPQVILNGREFRHWHMATAADEIAAVAQTPAAATITLTLKKAAQHDLDVVASVSLSENDRDAVLFLALAENGLTNQIDAGENAGLTLHHDFVVRRLAGPYVLEPQSTKVIKETLHIDREWIPRNMSVVAFVQQRSDRRILQTLTRPFCK